MKRLVVLFLVLLGVMGLNGPDEAAADITIPVCWKFTRPANSDPFPTDRIKAHITLFHSTKQAIVGSWVQEAAGCSDGTGVSGPANTNHPVLVPMVGSYQKDLDGNRRLVLDGTLQDICFNDPFIFECHIDARLDPETKNSIAGINGNAYAYCRNSTGSDYFPPENPFTNILNLERVDCSTVPNP
jgi:hypothetical protein